MLMVPRVAYGPRKTVDKQRPSTNNDKLSSSSEAQGMSRGHSLRHRQTDITSRWLFVADDRTNKLSSYVDMPTTRSMLSTTCCVPVEQLSKTYAYGHRRHSGMPRALCPLPTAWGPRHRICFLVFALNDLSCFLLMFI
jgi:hypothetical protein